MKNEITAQNYTSHYADVFGSKMHYYEEGTGTPILFLHDLPVSGHTWRKVIPYLATLGRCIAVDLIGTGKSDKPDIAYTIEDHINYIQQFIATLNLKKIILIMQGWGSIIGFTYALNHESNCKGLVFYEAFLRACKDDNFSLAFSEQILSLQQQENISDLIINSPYLVEQSLASSTLQPIAKQEIDFYSQPFLTKGSGKALYQYWLELPRGDGNSKIDKLIENYSKKLMNSALPKLMLYSIPGFITTVATLMWAKEHLSNLEIAEVGEDLHYAQESNPALIGETISVWLQGIEQP
jgi:haloalkane dehalogenase